MAIYGIGTDLVEVSRIERIYQQFGERFLCRILSPQEQALCATRSDKALFLAGRFAAKEAFVKALGTGFRQGVAFNRISVINDAYGKPTLSYAFPPDLFAGAVPAQILVSISHEKRFALAFVVIEC